MFNWMKSQWEGVALPKIRFLMTKARTGMVLPHRIYQRFQM